MKHLGDLTNPKVAACYLEVPDADMEKFKAFCQAYPYKQITRNGIEWSYLDNADNGDPLLLLSGAMVIPDISWLSIAHFGKTHRLIAPVYPAVRTMDELVRGIAEILQQEGIEKVHVLGGSYGGFVAQVFVRRYPDLTRSLVLSHTSPPDPANGRAIKRMIGWLPLLPDGLLRRLMGKMLGSMMPARTPKTALLHAMYEEVLYHTLTKADILSVLWRTIDYCAQEHTPQDLIGWPGKVLLALSDDDSGTPEPVRAAMSAMYPEARLHIFHGSGHATSILNEDEYQNVIDGFLSAS